MSRTSLLHLRLGRKKSLRFQQSRRVLRTLNSVRVQKPVQVFHHRRGPLLCKEVARLFRICPFLDFVPNVLFSALSTKPVGSGGGLTAVAPALAAGGGSALLAAAPAPSPRSVSMSSMFWTSDSGLGPVSNVQTLLLTHGSHYAQHGQTFFGTSCKGNVRIR